MGNSRSASRRRKPHQKSQGTGPSPQSESRWIKYALRGTGLAALLALVIYIVVDAGGDPPPQASPPEGTEEFEVADPEHVIGTVAYAQDPPVGGPHAATDVPCGYYDTEIPNELAVHTLEHGVVWITYAPGLSESEVAALADKATQRKVLVSPYPGLDSPIVASAWGRQLRLDTATDERLDQFIAAFQDGAQSPEPFAAC